MMDTNALLTIAFAMISNFTNIVDVPPAAVPAKPSDLERLVVGRPGCPVHLILAHHNGTEFWIGDGAIYRYSSRGSFFTLQDPSEMPLYQGASIIDTNGAVRIAEKALRSLTKRGEPLRDGTPTVQQGSLYQGKRIPFFRVTWPNMDSLSPAAQVEIDGRTGRIVCLDLWAECFYDPKFQEEIKKKVHAVQPPSPKQQLRWSKFPKPTLEEATSAIQGLSKFCRLLDMVACAEVDTTNVDLNLSWISASSARGVWSNGVCVVHACHIVFKSGACFDSAGGVASSYFSDKSSLYYGNDYRQEGQWTAFQGKPVLRWQDLAKSLESRIARRLGVPESFIVRLRARLRSATEEPAGHPLRRAIVGWRLLPPQPSPQSACIEERQLLRVCAGKLGFPMPVSPILSADEQEVSQRLWSCEPSLGPVDAEHHILDEMPDLLIAEFDLQTGELEGIEFCFPQAFWPQIRSLLR